MVKKYSKLFWKKQNIKSNIKKKKINNPTGKGRSHFIFYTCFISAYISVIIKFRYYTRIIILQLYDNK